MVQFGMYVINFPEVVFCRCTASEFWHVLVFGFHYYNWLPQPREMKKKNSYVFVNVIALWQMKLTSLCDTILVMEQNVPGSSLEEITQSAE